MRLTRNELDDAIRQPLTDFAGVLQETVDRSGARSGALVAVASAGGGARIPLITTTLSEHFGVPVITTAQPELTAAIGGGLQAARGTAEEGATAMAEAVAPPTAAAAAAVEATQMAPEVHPGEMGASTSEALAWSEADDIPDVAPTDPYDYPGAATTDAMGGPRPQMQFVEPETDQYEAAGRRPMGVLIVGLILVLAATAVAVWFLLRNNESTPSPSSTTVTTTTAPSPPPTSAAPPPPETQAPPPPPVTETITRAPETVTHDAGPAAAPATDERGATATATDVRGPAAPAGAAVDAAAAHPDTAVLDHSGSAVRSGTHTASGSRALGCVHDCRRTACCSIRTPTTRSSSTRRPDGYCARPSTSSRVRARTACSTTT